jgi:phosphatidylserine decarboxylase
LLAAAVTGGLVALALALPLAWKWQLGVRRSAPVACGLAVLSGLAVTALDAAVPLDGRLAVALVAGVTLGLCGTAVLWRFYRDPERAAPQREGVIVSPADGSIVYVDKAQRGTLPVARKRSRSYPLDELVRTPLRSDDAVVIGIGLSFLDVHVNRAPITGDVTAQRRYPGRFASLRDPAAVFTNERATTVLERPGLQVAVVLIASRLVRRIVTYVRDGDHVDVGQRIGAILFGSQVDVVLPDCETVRVLVQPGQRVRAGETVIAEVLE